MIGPQYIRSQGTIGEFPVFYYHKGLYPNHRMFGSDVQHWYSPGYYFTRIEDALWYDVPQTCATFQAGSYPQLTSRVCKYARKIGAQALVSHEKPWSAKTIEGKEFWEFTTGFIRRGNIDNYLIVEDKWRLLEYRFKNYTPRQSAWNKLKNLIRSNYVKNYKR